MSPRLSPPTTESGDDADVDVSRCMAVRSRGGTTSNGEPDAAAKIGIMVDVGWTRHRVAFFLVIRNGMTLGRSSSSSQFSDGDVSDGLGNDGLGGDGLGSDGIESDGRGKRYLRQDVGNIGKNDFPWMTFACFKGLGDPGVLGKIGSPCTILRHCWRDGLVATSAERRSSTSSSIP